MIKREYKIAEGDSHAGDAAFKPWHTAIGPYTFTSVLDHFSEESECGLALKSVLREGRGMKRLGFCLPLISKYYAHENHDTQWLLVAATVTVGILDMM